MLVFGKSAVVAMLSAACACGAAPCRAGWVARVCHADDDDDAAEEEPCLPHGFELRVFDRALGLKIITRLECLPHFILEYVFKVICGWENNISFELTRASHSYALPSMSNKNK